MAQLQFSRLLRLVGEELTSSIVKPKVRPIQLARNFGSQHTGQSRQPACKQRLLSVRPEIPVFVPSRGKVKKAPKGKSATTHKAQDFEIDEVVDVEAFEEQMSKHLAELREEYIFNLSVTTNIESFEKLPVQTNDGVLPLSHIAVVIQKSPSLILIDLQKKAEYMAAVTDALKKSQTSQNPQQSSPTTLAITIPKVSRERRETLAKSAKTLFNTRKAKLNKVFDEYSKQAQKNTTKKDLLKSAVDTLLKIKQETETKADEMMKAKQNELLKDNK